MSNTYSFRATSPDGTLVEFVYPESHVGNGENNKISYMNWIFKSDYERYVSETDPINPLVINSKVELLDEDDNTLWVGWVETKTVIKSEDGELQLEVVCQDPSGKLNNTAAYYDDYTFVKSSPALSITQEELLLVDITGDSAYWWYPNQGSNNWLPVDATPGGDETNNTVVEAASDIDTTLVATVDPLGLLPRGLLYIHTATPEIVSYDGYDDDGSGGKFQFKNLQRAQLGTTAQNIPGGTKVSQFLSMGIHPSEPIIVEAYNIHDSRWEALSTDYYVLQPNECAVTFSFDILDLDDEKNGYANKYNALRISCAVFDELNALTVDLQTVLEAILAADATLGGPGAFAVNVNVGDIRLTRVAIKEPLSTLDAINKLLNDTMLLTGKLTDPVGFWYDHINQEYNIQLFTQKLTPDIIYEDYEHVEEDISVEDVYSAAVINYNLGLDYNLISPTRTWHPAVGDSLGSGTVSHIWLMDYDKADGGGWKKDNTVSVHEHGTYRIIDGISNTGWAISSIGDPGDNCQVLWCWFTDAVDTIMLDNLEITYDFRNKVYESFDVNIYGITSFNTSNPPASTGLVDLSASLFIGFDSQGTVLSSSGQGEVKVSAKDIGVECQGIVIVFNHMPADNGGGYRRAAIRNIRATSLQNKQVFVKIGDTATDSTIVYAPASYAKLVSVNDNLDQHRVRFEKIGTASKNMAISLGRLLVQDSLVLTQIRTFIISSIFIKQRIPTLGQTIQVGTYIGICIKYNHKLEEDGEETLDMDLLDLTARLI
jgi:hypothetical protein